MQPREITIKTRALEFAAQEWGDSQGTHVIALHGWLDNSASFTPAGYDGKIKWCSFNCAGYGRAWLVRASPGRL